MAIAVAIPIKYHLSPCFYPLELWRYFWQIWGRLQALSAGLQCLSAGHLTPGHKHNTFKSALLVDWIVNKPLFIIILPSKTWNTIISFYMHRHTVPYFLHPNCSSPPLSPLWGSWSFFLKCRQKPWKNKQTNKQIRAFVLPNIFPYSKTISWSNKIAHLAFEELIDFSEFSPLSFQGCNIGSKTCPLPDSSQQLGFHFFQLLLNNQQAAVLLTSLLN